MRVACAALLVAGIAASLGGQTPSQRAALITYRSSIDRRVDSTVLRAEADELTDSISHHRTDDLAPMRLGFLEVRISELRRDRWTLTRAEELFSDVIHKHGDWPMAYAGRAFARLDLAGNVIGPGVAHVVQSLLIGDPGGAAADDIQKGAELDSTFTYGLEDVVAVAMQGYKAGQLRAALLATRQVKQMPLGRSMEAGLARLRLERAVGDLDTSMAVGAALLSRYPDNPEVMLEAAHSRLHTGDQSAGALWFRGLALADSVASQLYRSDLVSLLPDSVLRKFDAAHGTDRANVVRDFLELDDPQLLRTGAERLREHYRRLDAARLNYALPKAAFAAGRVASAGHIDIDDRGIVLVMHGEPDEHTSFNLMSAPPNESWYYKGRQDDDLIFHFIRPDAVHGFVRVPSIFDIVARTTSFRETGKSNVEADLAAGKAVQTHGASWTAQTIQELLYSRENVSPYYSRLLSGDMKAALELQKAERAAGDSSLVHRETWSLSYELPLDASLDALAVGADGAAPVMQAAFAIPGSALYAKHNGARIYYPVRMRVTVLQGRTLVARIDTLRNMAVAREVAPDDFLLGRLPIPLAPGDYTVRMAVEVDGRGTVAPPQTIHVAAGTTSRLDLSDLALGARSVPLPSRLREGDTLWVNPTRSFAAREPMQVYFEINGIKAATAYQAALRVYRAGDTSPQIAVTFAGRAATSPAGVHREVDLGRFKAGSYALEIMVTGADGSTAVRRRPFVIRK